MAIPDHPSFAHPSSTDLLLWQSGELSPEQAEEILHHIAGCEECQAKIAELEALYGDIASVDDEAAQYRMQEALQQRPRPFWQRWSIHPRWMAATASVVIAALLLATFTEYASSARAEVLLSRAVREENSHAEHVHLLKIESAGMNCNVILSHVAATVAASGSDRELCGRIAENLHAAGWNWNSLLSARSFKQWRNGLREKKDSIRRLPDASEVTTATSEGSLHRATLRLRDADYYAVQARFVFASTNGEEEPEFAVTESDEIPQEAMASAPRLTAPSPNPLPPSLPLVDLMDVTEAEARLALHRIGADRNVLLSVSRERDAVKVVGVVPAEAQVRSITASLDGLTNVQTQITAEGVGQAVTSWKSFHGDAPPLAYEQVNALYPNDPQARQQFINNLDAITLRLAGEAQTRDGLLLLVSRPLAKDMTVQLRSAANEVQANMAADIAALAAVLQPFTGPIASQAGHLTYAQATQLYTLVHELVFMSRGDHPIGLQDALDQLRQLLAGK